MPGRHYDITLALVQAGQTSTLQRQVTTEDDADTSSIPTEPDSPAFDQGPSDDHAQSTLSTSPSHTIASTPPNAPQQPTFTLEDRLAQLKHTLHIINTERESLVISLKSSRRESQKADAALRSEIDILKRASEKHIAGEHRSKQKILALQEAVKQAQNATRETEERAKEVEELLPSLAEEREQVEAEWRRMKAEADRSRGEKDQEEERCKKRMEGMKSELVGLSQRLDRLNGRRDKLEGSIVPELEEKLKEVEREVERAERATSRRGSGGGGNGGVFDMDEVVMDADHPLSPNFLPMQRRQQSFGSGPGLIGRPVPIQRPYEGYGPSPAAQWNAIPRQAQVHNHNHNPRASSLHQQTPTVLANPQRRGSLKSSPSITNSNSSNSNLPSTPNKNASTPTHTSDSSPTHTAHSSASGSPTAPHAPPPPITSTLSSRAPSFEPSIGGGKGKKGTHTNRNGNAPVPTMIMQRPPGGPRNLSRKQWGTWANDVRWVGIHGPSYGP
ncbi:hypothetical protein BDQ12DRAFT_722465 [Crucibulum laeve]|uniref:Uncharacterized protein n=1 Tax=Crucibulum laeve TaxID=68775 RepID=A0A5C3M472_9AGAR|nr:hypothetical protein BDQ12DRAFT_722465 [Crucibulum laeve]